MPTEHLVFSHTIDVLFRSVLAEQVTDDVRARLKAIGLDLSRPLDLAYPLAVFDDALEVVAVHGLAHLPKPEALRRMGELQVEAFAQTLVGRATFTLLKLLSTRRVLSRLTQSFRSANNFIEATVTEVDATHFVVRFNDVGRFPEVFQGILSAGMVALGRRAEVSIGAREGTACEYLMAFTA